MYSVNLSGISDVVRLDGSTSKIVVILTFEIGHIYINPVRVEIDVLSNIENKSSV